MPWLTTTVTSRPIWMSARDRFALSPPGTDLCAFGGRVSCTAFFWGQGHSSRPRRCRKSGSPASAVLSVAGALRVETHSLLSRTPAHGGAAALWRAQTPAGGCCCRRGIRSPVPSSSTTCARAAAEPRRTNRAINWRRKLGAAVVIRPERDAEDHRHGTPAGGRPRKHHHADVTVPDQWESLSALLDVALREARPGPLDSRVFAWSSSAPASWASARWTTRCTTWCSTGRATDKYSSHHALLVMLVCEQAAADGLGAGGGAQAWPARH